MPGATHRWPEGEPRRIVVLRPLQRGDLLCAVPALRALHHGFPGAHIDLVGLPWARDFTARFSRYLDGFLAFPGFPGLPEREPDLPRIPRFLDEVQAIGYDLAIQLHGSGGITNPLTALLGARALACFYRPGEWRPAGAISVRYPENEHEVHRLLALAQALGAPDCGDELEFPVGAGDRLDLQVALEGAQIAGRYAVIHPGSRAAARRWHPESFAAVADGLAADGIHPVLTGSEAEAPIVAAVVGAMRAPATNLCGRTSAGALAALIERASVLVCNDTGVSHLAAALRTPSVVVFLASEVNRWAPLDGALHRVVEPSLTLGGPHPETVLAEAESLLQSEPAIAAR